ncbi:DgyrCDS6564 [Dimorphilus gyrociliatus]|uniref:DgyrCDS6564 n=1 Tax=Dimorphilus gyrociliatus TaxID=2664684 RepID=A0A7I8VPZ2_9ANNE|nr:DgyrCDS6564 [Dimorphilus gyrociliatus]
MSVLDEKNIYMDNDSLENDRNRKYKLDTVKEAKKKEREEKKLKKQQDQLKRQYEREVRKQTKPGECQKLLTALIEPSVIKLSYGPGILDSLTKQSIKYDIQEQPIAGLITFVRQISSLKQIDGKLDTDLSEQLEKNALYLMSLEEFLNCVSANNKPIEGSPQCNLSRRILYLNEITRHRQLTVFVKGLDDHYRDQRRKENKAYKAKCQGNRKNEYNSTFQVTKNEIDQALIEIQIKFNVIFRFFEKDADIATAIAHYAKAIAEYPFKKQRMESNFSFHAESSGSLRVADDGSGVSHIWKNQLQQFKNVSTDVANAIVSHYPTPSNLLQAYERVPITEAQHLLQNIEVRRGAGLVSTSRKVGKELSKKLHTFITSQSDNIIVQ